MSGRIGALNTAGSGCVDPLGVPSCEAMVTVGRVAIVAVVVWLLAGFVVVWNSAKARFMCGPRRARPILVLASIYAKQDLAAEFLSLAFTITLPTGVSVSLSLLCYLLCHKLRYLFRVIELWLEMAYSCAHNVVV